MNSPLLSIIVPVYNVERYLKQCIDSILNQSFKEYELILIDDGSPDRCGIICEEYAKKDSRITVIHKKNGGLSSARNAGIELAGGMYVTFVDSDDTVSQDIYTNNIDILLSDPSIDLLEFPAYIYYQSPKAFMRKEHPNHVFGKDNIFIDWMKREGYLHAYACNKIYKTSLFEDIRFPEGKNFEDTHTLPLILDHCSHIYLSDKGLYYYYLRTSSITNSATYKNYCDSLEANIAILKKSFHNPELKEETSKLYICTANVAINAYCHTNKTNEERFKNLIREIGYIRLSPVSLLHLNVSLYTKFKNIPLSLFGLQYHCKLFRYIKSICQK